MADTNAFDNWIDGDPDHEKEEDSDGEQPWVGSDDPTLFQLELRPVGQSGDFHTRNKPGQKQREVVTGYSAGSKKKPSFYVGCEAKAIIHGELDQTSRKRATLLVYDFTFFSHRSVRIKEATIHFEFRSKGGIAGAGPLVLQVAPFATHVMMQTTAKVREKKGVSGGPSAGISVAKVKVDAHYDKEVEKTVTYAAEVTGNRPADDWGNQFQATWFMKENDSQHNGIARQLRACILLTRENDEEFQLFPTIDVKPSFQGWAASLFETRPPDDPVLFDPEYDPYNTLGVDIDPLDLDAVPLDSLWDCTFQHSFGDALKISKSGLAT